MKLDKEIDLLLTEMVNECCEHDLCRGCKYHDFCEMEVYDVPANWSFTERDITKLVIKAWEQRRNHDGTAKSE